MRKTCWPNSYSEFIFCYLHRMMQCFGDLSVADPGEEPETAPPLSKGLDDRPPLSQGLDPAMIYYLTQCCDFAIHQQFHMVHCE